MDLALEGRVETVPPADLFAFIRHTRRTSLVVFERSDQETRIFCKDGAPVWATSTRPQLQFESRVSGQGRVKLRDIETCLQKYQTSTQRIPQALVADGFFTPSAILAELQALASDVLRDATTWKTGTFVVYDSVAPPAFVPRLPRSTFLPVLLETLRSALPESELQKHFSSRKHRFIARKDEANEYPLSADELATLEAVDGKRGPAEIAQKTGLSEKETLRDLYVLCSLRVVEFVEPKGLEGSTQPVPVQSPSAPVAAAAPEPPAKPRTPATTNKLQVDPSLKSLAPAPPKAAPGDEKTKLFTAAEAKAAVATPPAPRAPDTKDTARAAAEEKTRLLTSEETRAAVAGPPPAPASVAPSPQGSSAKRVGEEDTPPSEAVTGELPQLRPEDLEPKATEAPKRVRRTLEYMLNDTLATFELVGELVSIGRHPKNNVTLQDPRISSFHCKLERDGAEWSLVDLKSRNGVYVNNTRVERARLKANDEIRIGGTKVKYIVER